MNDISYCPDPLSARRIYATFDGVALPEHKLPDLLTAREVAEYLGTSVDTLAVDRYRQRGIPYIKIGRRVRYRVCDINAYLNDHTVEPAK